MAKKKMFDLQKLRLNPNNPYPEREADWPKFLERLKENPDYLALRPIVYDDKDFKDGRFLVLGGNKRTRGLLELGYSEVPEEWVRPASMLTEEQKHEFVIADNVNWGEWDMAILNEQWGDSMGDWGLIGGIGIKEQEEEYSRKASAPTYKPREPEPPAVETLYGDDRTKALIAVINEVEMPEDVRAFLTMAAYRHTVFDYERIAEYYAHAPKEIQELMEDSALIIIDFNKAIELGYVQLNADILNQFTEDYG